MSYPEKYFSVRLNGGRSNQNHAEFYRNVLDMNGKTIDYTGHLNDFVIKSSWKIEWVHEKVTMHDKEDNFPDDVKVEEITRSSVVSRHNRYLETIQNVWSDFLDLP